MSIAAIIYTVLFILIVISSIKREAEITVIIIDYYKKSNELRLREDLLSNKYGDVLDRGRLLSLREAELNKREDSLNIREADLEDEISLRISDEKEDLLIREALLIERGHMLDDREWKLDSREISIQKREEAIKIK